MCYSAPLAAPPGGLPRELRHPLNNLLAVIKSSRSLLERELGPDRARALTYLAAANRALDEAVEIVHNASGDWTA